MGEVAEDHRKADVAPIYTKGKEEDPGNYRPDSHSSIPGKVMGQLMLETISRHMNKTVITRSTEHGLTTRKSCLTNLMNFHDEMTSLVDDKRAVDTVYLDFRKVFDTLSQKILTDKLLKYRLDEQ